MTTSSKPNRTFLYQVLTMVGLLAGASAYANACPMNIMSPEYPMWKQAREVAEASAEEPLDALVLGDSRAKAGLVPEELGQRGFSLTVGGATPIELRWLLREYLENNPAPRRLIISLAPEHLVHAEVFWERTVKFGLLSSDEIDAVLAKQEALGDDVLNASLAADWESKLYRWRLAPIYYGEYLASLGFLRRGKNRAVLAQLERDHGRYHFGTAAAAILPSKEAEWSGFTPSRLLVQEFDALLEDVATLPCEVSFVLAPISERTSEELDPRYTADLTEFLRERAQRFPSIAIDLEAPVYPDEAFGDPGHLKAEGARAFSCAIGSGSERSVAGYPSTPTREGC